MKSATAIISIDNAPKVITTIRNPTHETLPKIRREQTDVSQSPIVAEGNAVMVQFRLSPIADTIRNRLASTFTNEDVIALALCSLCQSRAASRESSQDRIHDTSEQNRAEDDRGNASHFEDGKLPRIECHAGIVGDSSVTRL